MNVNTGEKGRVHRAGPNYVIAITEGGDMFRAWVTDIREVQETINKERKSSILNNGKAETND